MTLKTQGLQAPEQIRTFLAGSVPLDFTAPQRAVAYAFVAARLCYFDYLRLGRAERG